MRNRCRMWDWNESKYAEMREKFCHAFEYDETSESFLRWKDLQSNRRKPGDVAGCLDPSGYWCVRFESEKYQIHQVVWIMHGNTIPEPLSVDHDDRKRTNNNINNLRLGNDSVQGINRGNWGKSKYKGVSWNKKSKKWQAHILIYRKQKRIGEFKTEIEAARAWDAEAITLGRTDLNFP